MYLSIGRNGEFCQNLRYIYCKKLTIDKFKIGLGVFKMLGQMPGKAIESPEGVTQLLKLCQYSKAKSKHFRVQETRKIMITTLSKTAF